MEGGVEGCHLRHTRIEFKSDFDAFEIGGVVQGSKRHELSDIGHHFLIDQHSLLVRFAAVHHTMAYAGQFAGMAKDFKLRGYREDEVKAFTVSRNRPSAHNFIESAGLV